MTRREEPKLFGVLSTIPGGVLLLATVLLACSGKGAAPGVLGKDIPIESFAPKLTQLSRCLGQSHLSEVVVDSFAVAQHLGGESHEALRQRLECFSSASDCGDFFECYGLQEEADCDLSTFVWECDADAVITCAKMPDGSGRVRRIPCVSYGELNPLCIMAYDELPLCGAGSCVEEDEVQCDGDIASSCFLGVALRTDCSAQGLSCFDGSEGTGWAGCRTDIPCTTPRCDGTLLIPCTDGYEGAPTDCSWFDRYMSCVLEGGNDESPGTAMCGFDDPAEECDDGFGAEVGPYCEGAVAHICVLGAWLEVDCSTFMDSNCEVSTGDAPSSHLLGSGIGCVP